MGTTLLTLVKSLVVSAGILTMTFSAGCSNSNVQKLGTEIPSTVKKVELARVLDEPGSFDGKQVVLKGFISGQCPSLCEFFYREGPHKVTIWPSGYSFPKLETGSPVRVYADVVVGEERIVFNALGLEVYKRNKS